NRRKDRDDRHHDHQLEQSEAARTGAGRNGRMPDAHGQFLISRQETRAGLLTLKKKLCAKAPPLAASKAIVQPVWVFAVHWVVDVAGGMAVFTTTAPLMMLGL